MSDRSRPRLPTTAPLLPLESDQSANAGKACSWWKKKRKAEEILELFNIEELAGCSIFTLMHVAEDIEQWGGGC